MKPYAVCGVVMIDNKVLLVRHTYGMANNRILIPGGHVKEHELATDAIIREIFEETKVHTQVESIISVQFKPEQWCIVFKMKYLSGTPESDNYENSEILLLPLKEAIEREDITNTSRVILETVYTNKYNELTPSEFCSPISTSSEFKIFGVI